MLDWSQFRPAESISLPDRISIDIERLMLDGKLTEGDKLPSERELASIFSTSRVSLRQALRELEIRGLIDRKPGRGTTILSRGHAASSESGQLANRLTKLEPEIAQIIEFRALIEPPTAALAATRATPRDIVQLEELLASMTTDISTDRYVELDKAFHQAISRSTYNPLLSAVSERLAHDVAPVRDARMQSDQRRLNSMQEHEEILDAIRSHDSERAEIAARFHIESISAEISRRLNTADPSSATAEAIPPAQA
ncbi:FadR/GntR family transcriptional regulator [Glaciibacter psychrotolerans]|uniref:GntR family transcriptional repressor for pyruvate dehydrogenase complex n=1 Tax=Glaciibacter psychrotolerans TaxID=670054 RepID=A0A7Z0J7K4_9MICO|nr:FCD domain-containing protein [Leifsonia psychrotolerans]NYJ21068.1 GntR family transcriptional repressor for pyruvate dehydrogenase complex [Leifsonia psychrotolerans]